MVRVFITGSSDGIGQAAAKLLAEQGHHVVLHARNAERAAQAHAAIPQAKAVLVGDLSSLSETRQLAASAVEAGPFDAVVHNAAIGYGSTSSRKLMPDGTSAVFAVNTLAPYVLACLMGRPTTRICFVSSAYHASGNPELRGAAQSHSYADSKLHDVMLSKAFARRWRGVQSVSLDPGWVRTKLGGGAPTSADRPAGALAQWAQGVGRLAEAASGAHLDCTGEKRSLKAADDVARQDELMRICEEISGVSIPDDA